MDSLLDLDLLKTFATVVEQGELKKAAAVLFRSQAAISMQLKRLEQQTGVRVLERSNQGIHLTPSGETLLRHAEKLLRANNAALAALKQQHLTGTLRVGIPTDYAHDFLRHFMPILSRELPNLEPRITCQRSRTLRQLVNRGELDIAIVSGESGFTDHALLWREQLVWAVGKEADQETHNPLPLATFDSDCIMRDLTQSTLKHANIAYHTVFTSPELDNIAAAVNAGIAIALLPQSMLDLSQARPLTASPFGQGLNLDMHMIASPIVDATLLPKLADCLRRAGSRLNNALPVMPMAG
ncbi:LysR family transcriptional regulator [Atopomonas sediminilitoris]|uniref:LysR family transcriptional regulator n=1 Tax=Atopomonas sediminilitoris TaxID=2919919 RepID=UPI001F4EBA61|nr:LysR family transcriptional regulator [Atopomonas sediminilitoris]MCJ8170007.1 LysR family transcriptional regulator [Atopomonas sediminilitoris]